MSSTQGTQTSFAGKMQKYGWAIALFLMLIATYQTCSSSKKVAALKKQVQALPTAEQVSTEIQIEGLRTSKRMLYDNNAIIRTTVRPDDRMNEYDAEIKKLQKK
jgi:hypothetical protein